MEAERRPIPFPRPGAPARAALTFMRHGPGAVGDAELIGLALGGSLRASSAARRLLVQLDGLGGVARANADELRDAGIGPRAALGLAAGIEVGRRLAAWWPEPIWVVRTPGDVGERLCAAMGGLEREELRVLLLDAKNVVTAARTVYVGNVAGSAVRVGEVFRDAVRACAAAIVVVHNHPSGDPTPSGEDLRITAELVEAGRLLDIELLDHVICGRGRWISLRALGAIGQGASTMR